MTQNSVASGQGDLSSGKENGYRDGNRNKQGYVQREWGEEIKD